MSSQDKSTRVIRITELMLIISLRKSTIYSLVKQGKLPAPTKIIPGGRASGWLDHQINNYLLERFGGPK